MAYRGTGDQNTRVFRPDDFASTQSSTIDIEYTGLDASGKTVQRLDSGLPKARYAGAKTVIQTDGFSAAPFNETARAINSA